MKRAIKPRDATTERAHLRLQTDNWETKNFWILLNAQGGVTLAKQRNGENAEWIVQVPFRDFNALVDWYLREQPPRKPKGRKSGTIRVKLRYAGKVKPPSEI